MPPGAGSLREVVPPALSLSAPAKVNLTLEVLRRREDGYHDIRTVMQAVTLADRLTFSPARTLELRCSQPQLEGPTNLVWRAAELLRRETGTTRGARVTLEKRIPMAAGLGGGSSDAAATLLGLNALWSLGLTRSALRDLGGHLGSDVPFFLGDGACAVAEGRGERLTPLPGLPSRWVLLVKAPLAISTADVYHAVPPERWSDGSRTASWLQARADRGIVPLPFNHLEPVALDLAPGAAVARDALLRAGASHAVMSGSGPTYFALFATELEAQAVRARLGAAPLLGAAVYLGRFGSLVDVPSC